MSYQLEQRLARRANTEKRVMKIVGHEYVGRIRIVSWPNNKILMDNQFFDVDRGGIFNCEYFRVEVSKEIYRGRK